MATQNNPLGNNSLSVNLLPKFYQTPANKKFLQATIDQLFQPGTVTKTTGFIGRKNAKAATGADIYVEAENAARQNYQLEPGLVITDALGNVTFFKDYIDYINQVSVFGGNTSNHERINKQEFYSWDPHIDWDKIVNFQNYYWMPYGPETITVYGNQLSASSTYNVEIQVEGNSNEYLFTPNGLTLNPVLKLFRGQTYTFIIKSPGNPFSFKTVRSIGVVDRYLTGGIDAYGVEDGIITFTVPDNAPSLLFYQSETDINLGGAIAIFDIAESSGLDVENEILGKRNYTLSDGTPLSNGMKLEFAGTVTPSKYASGQYYVEGVGTAIKLVQASSLMVITPYTTNESIEFDTVPFDTEPFEDDAGFAGTVDYITINRASQDSNQWSRYNRWFHESVITASATYNGNTPALDQSLRATRPIIEFEANLQMFNMGSVAVPDIDLVDSYTTDIFSIIEGSRGYNVDGIVVTPGQRILFTADTDPMVANKIYTIGTVNISGYDQLTLLDAEEPLAGQTALVRYGVKNQGSTYWFDGSTWKLGQQKLAVNQAPLFDIVDENGVSFGDISVYNGSTFAGTKLFSYQVGTGVNDTQLGFPLSYQNVANIGDIVFNFNLVTDSFDYKNNNVVVTQSIDIGYLKKYDYAGVVGYVNGWQMSDVMYIQFAIRVYKDSGKTNGFDIDMFDNIDLLNFDSDDIRVYVNDQRMPTNTWSLSAGSVYYKITFTQDIKASDIVTIKVHSDQPINSNGYYEIPINLQNNPLNNSLSSFTLGEIINHVDTIIDNIYQFNANGIPSLALDSVRGSSPVGTFVGVFPGVSNLHDLGSITKYGTKFVQHSGPLSLASYHITSETTNVIKAIKLSRDDYSDFKRNFIATAGTLGKDASAPTMVDLILTKMTANSPNTAPYYFTDMVPFGAKIVSDLDVVDYRIKKYPLSNVFTLDKLSNKAVGVYLNGVQLVHGKDYTFDASGMVTITSTLANGDVITTQEYDNTDGCFVPSTPTKLGMWPKYEPKMYLDTTLLVPQMMIQGHDGSLILAYNDYRDDIILELEKRIYNNIKVQYDTTIFDISQIIPGYNRKTDYSMEEFNAVLAPNFYSWSKLIGTDYTKSLSFDRANPFTFNYSENSAPDGSGLPGFWRGVYRWVLDTDRPHLCPWEMLGFSIQPQWWTSVYGPAPYSSDNLIMWQDLAAGIVREPGKPLVTMPQYARPVLLTNIPVDESGNLLSPYNSGIASGTITQNINSNYIFGDCGPIETAWRRSSHYAFSIISTFILLNPSNTMGLLIDRSRVVRNKAGQLVYSETGLRIRPADVVIPSIYTSKTRVQTAGLVNYIVEYLMHYIFSNNTSSYNGYLDNLSSLGIQLSYRIGAFTNKDQFNLLLESKTPSSTGSIFIPAEDYSIFLNSSSAIKSLNYSGVMVTRLSTGYEVTGYSNSHPYFSTYAPTQPGVVVNIGGISASYSTWTAGQHYIVGSVVKYGAGFYRSTANSSSTTFDTSLFAPLPSLPIVGGVTVFFRSGWDKKQTVNVPYGTIFDTAQDVVDFLLGYGEYLKAQGFVFDEFNGSLGMVTNWETSAKEFLFWTTQNWTTGSEKWTDWIPNQPILYSHIVRYNGDYYSANFNIPAEPTFDADKYNKLDGLSTIGSSVISLSPAASGITFETPMSVVENIGNNFNDYEIFKVDGTPIPLANLTSYRDGNTITYKPTTTDGIYNASFYLVQNEHVILLKNTTIFNDVIYAPESGYRRERIKVSGYVTINWNGSLDIPGFIFDQASIQNWQQWQDYNMGDVISFQGHYYSATEFIAGTTAFVPSKWTQLKSKPTAKILPNWTNLATQFTDFYSLDVDSFDAAQQSVGQHLIGYQKRQYLNNIIQDDVSEFKFFQGMIREKGTQNVLNKLFGVLSSDNMESLIFYEEWALRVGQYGASAAFDNIEFILDEDKFHNNPQGFVLVNSHDSTLSPFTIQQVPNDVYLKPLGYDSKPFPVKSTGNTYLRSAGYVNPADVFMSLGTMSEILNQNIATFTAGAYVWCSFDGPSWNVFQLTDLNIRVKSVDYTGDSLTITTADRVPVTAGSFIGLTNVDLLQRFYQVTSATLSSFTITTTIKDFPSPFTQTAELKVYVFVSQRTTSIDNIDAIVPATIADNSLLWTDDSGNGSWATWQYKAVFEKLSIADSDPASNLDYGNVISMNTQSSIVGFGTNTGTVTIHDKVGISVGWVQRQVIQEPFIALPGQNPSSSVATVIAFSDDGKWMATGSPLAGYALTQFSGPFASHTSYNAGSVVQYTSHGVTLFYVALVTTTQTPSSTASDWTVAPYIPTTTFGTHTGPMEQGVISIYVKDDNNIYNLIDTIVSQNPIPREHFGSSLAFGDNVLYVGATGSNSIYELNYKSTPRVSTSYNPVGSSFAVISVTSTAGIRAGMFVTNPAVPGAFVSGEYVMEVIDAVTLLLSGSPNSTPNGELVFSTISWQYNLDTQIQSANYDGSGNVVLSRNGKLLLVSGQGTVNIYDVSAGFNTLVYTQTGTGAQFGEAVAISDDGSYFAVSDPLNNTYGKQSGLVSVYARQASGSYTKYQDLVNRLPEIGGRFGTKIAFMNDYDTLVVLSADGDATVTTTFDNTTTTFDKELTKFASPQVNSGRVDIFDRYNTQWVFSESLENTSAQSDGYGHGFAVGDDAIFVSAPYATDKGLKSGLVYSYGKTVGTRSWNIARTQTPVVDISKVKKAFLYNKDLGTLAKHIDVIDPLQGKIAGIAEEEISLKTFYDPAVYTIGTEDVTVNDTSFWSKAQVGKLWWDLRTAKFLETAVDDIDYKNNNWNTLATGASIDVYEWVETKYLPANWDAQADSPAGLAAGISGTSLYGNSSYSVTKRYDNISKTFYNTYYFWVKNKRIVPPVAGRHITAENVAALIANPRGQGYSYVSLTSENSFSLVNVKHYLADTSVALSLEYWLIDKTDQNVHSQWKLISNDSIVELPHTIELKWIDSLCGIDQGGRPVPDMALPPKLRYGIENRPRQGMFVNRVEALKELIERVNRTLLVTQISETYDLTGLKSYDVPPALTTGMYDQAIDVNADLTYVNVSGFTRPSLKPIIVDGRITGVTVVTKGSGYLTPPTITVNGTGIGAQVQYNADNTITVTNSGEGYSDSTTLSVRDYSVLIRSDDQANGNWSIYSYDPSGKVWSRVLTQSYDVTKYWRYVDWYATGFSQFTAADYAVNTFVGLNSITPNVGDLVKVLTANAGGWLLLQKYADVQSIDWTQIYNVVGIENGTIQFNSSLYEFSGTNVGYDASTFDGASFDVVAATELRIILTSIKNDLFIGTLKQNYLDLFIASIHYAHSEQVFIDWAFKTSFVRATHKVGQLAQPINYPINNLPNFQDYIDEVKPYRTKVREYISNYSGVPQTDGVDWNYSQVDDFDLPPVYENGVITTINAQVVNGKVVVGDPFIQQNPWKQWFENVGFNILDIKITNGGYGYVSAPAVNIITDSGTGAVAQAFISEGSVTRIVLLAKGTGFLSAPTIEFLGGLGPAAAKAATATAIIGDGVVRSSLIAMKFDRVSSTYFITDLNISETFVSYDLQHNLQWAPDITIGKSSVTINGIPVLREMYTLTIITTIVDGSTQYTGQLLISSEALAIYPALNSSQSAYTIVVKYLKDVSLLNAADRIQYYYDPTTGSLGKDLAQLMTGIDYGGVQVNGLGFEVSAGWSELPYATEGWDVYDNTFTDFTIQVDGSVHSFTLPYTPADGVELNVYQSKQYAITYPSDNSTLDYSYDVNVPSVEVSIINTVNSTGSNPTGSITLSVTSTSHLAVGDIVTTAGATLAYNTSIVSIDSSTQVTLNQILFNSVSANTAFTFTRAVGVPDVIMTKTGTVTFDQPVGTGSTIRISGTLSPVRLDDPHYGTNQQTNASAIMVSPVGDGATSIVTVPSQLAVGAGDVFIIRQSTSDGAVLPQSNTYDTDITGGDLAYSSATGIAADDIVIDGDDFVTPTSSPAPEEVVPGQVVDAVAIKVFDQRASGSAEIKVDNYVADGIRSDYKITQQPNSSSAVIVKLGSNIATSGPDYHVDYRSGMVKFTSVPASGVEVSIFSIGFNGANILDLDYFVSDGTTVEFVTRAPWVTTYTPLIYVDGVPATVTFFKTDATYATANAIGIRFSSAPEAGALINYIIVSGNQQTFAITQTERITGTGVAVYPLTHPVGKELPAEANMIVRVGQQVLEAADNSYYTVEAGVYDYTIDAAKFLPNSTDARFIKVYANGVLLKQGADYRLNLGGITVIINKKTNTKYLGKKLVVSIAKPGQYTYDSATNSIVFDQPYDNSQTIEVVTSYVHDILDIQRTTFNVTSAQVLTPDTLKYYYYKSVSSGLITLDRTVINDNYVWVLKNGRLLTPSIDYKLNSDFQSIQLATTVAISDAITVMLYSSNVLNNHSVSYMQFKDMLNRVTYTRLNKMKQTTLAQDLHWNDTTIVVDNAADFEMPSTTYNRPGVVEIRGERIEYFGLNGNILSKLRRGTLGTGVNTLVTAGSLVQELGMSETIPYTDNTVTDQIVSNGKRNQNGTQTVSLDFVPSSANDIEVFVGGYDTLTVWEANTAYSPDTIVTIGAYTYKCVTAHTSSKFFNDDLAKWEFFIGNIRLKKAPYAVFNVNNAPYSPAGDVTFPADFTVDGTTAQLTLTNPVAIGTRITVIKRTGVAWDSAVNVMDDGGKIASFINAVPGIWYAEYK